MNLLFKNFRDTLRRYKAASTLNVIGLSVSLAAFAVILMQVHYDLTYDRFHSQHDRIFRLESQWDGTYSTSVSRPVYNLLKESFPEIESIGLVYLSLREVNYKPIGSGEEYPFKIVNREVTPELFDIFDFSWTEGGTGEFTDPYTLVIPQSFAERIFPGKQAVGQFLIEREADSIQWRIVGVYRDFPENSTLKNDSYVNRLFDDSSNLNWGNSMYTAYLLVREPAQTEELAAAIGEAVRENAVRVHKNLSYRLTSLRDTHYLTDYLIDMTEKISRSRTTLFLSIAVLIIVIAMINFMNFSNALAPARLRGINTMKILGSSNGQIRRMILTEAVGLCLIAALIAVWLVSAAARTGIADLIVAKIEWSADLLIGLFGTALLAGIIAGIHPAFYMTSFPPALAIKGSFGLSPQGRKMRTALIAFQYVVSLTLLIVAIFIHVQSNYMKAVPMGFDRENLLQSRIPASISSQYETFREKLLQNPRILEVGFSNDPLVTLSFSSRFTINHKEGDITYDYRMVSKDYLRTLGIDITEGRDFISSDTQKERPGILFNETARQKYGLEIGEKVNGQEILGFFSDFNYRSLYTEIEPMGIQVRGIDPRYYFSYAFYRVSGTDVRSTIEHIEQVIREMAPGFIYANPEFVDQYIGELYAREDKLAMLVSIFSFLAMVISLIGVFGLILFETQYRRKEIGLRRINGATVSEILRLLNGGYIRVVLICFVIAAPAAYYVVSRWLESFPYRSPVHWWIFALSLAAVLTITLLTVTLQSWRAANENPAKTIKSE